MNKHLLIKYLQGQVSKKEEQLVHFWILQNEDNKKYFINLKNLYILQSMPNSSLNEKQKKNLDFIKKSNPKQKKNSRYIIFSFSKYIAAAILIFSVFLNVYLYKDAREKTISSSNVKRVLLSSLDHTSKLSFFTNKGVRAVIELPDGSEVMLNSDSKITYPEKFTGPTREVELSGEAYFKVKKDSTFPMIVRAKDILIKVTGTEFNVKAYDNDLAIKTTLIEGKVSVISKSEYTGKISEAVLKPSQSYTYDLERVDHSVLSSLEESKINLETAWRRGEINFNRTPIKEVIKELERAHSCHFSVSDNKILDEVFTASFENESLVQILEILKYCSTIDYSIKGKEVFLSYK